jgi:hypothetical protein
MQYSMPVGFAGPTQQQSNMPEPASNREAHAPMLGLGQVDLRQAFAECPHELPAVFGGPHVDVVHDVETISILGGQKLKAFTHVVSTHTSAIHAKP